MYQSIYLLLDIVPYKKIVFPSLKKNEVIVCWSPSASKGLNLVKTRDVKFKSFVRLRKKDFERLIVNDKLLFKKEIAKWTLIIEFSKYHYIDTTNSFKVTTNIQKFLLTLGKNSFQVKKYYRWWNWMYFFIQNFLEKLSENRNYM